MNSFLKSYLKFVVTAVRVVMFTSSVFGLLAVLRFVLSHPATRAALGISLLFVALGTILMAAAWTLRRMWTATGQLASVIVPAPSPEPMEEQA